MSDRKPSSVRSDGEKFVCSECHWSSPVNDYTHNCLSFLKSELEAAISRAEEADRAIDLIRSRMDYATEEHAKLMVVNADLEAQLSEANREIERLQLKPKREGGVVCDLSVCQFDDLNNQIAELKREIGRLNDIIRGREVTSMSLNDSYEKDIAELKEQLTEKDSSLEISKGVLASQFVKRINDHNRIRDFIAAWQNQNDNEIDTAFDALVELVESPPTGGEG